MRYLPGASAAALLLLIRICALTQGGAVHAQTGHSTVPGTPWPATDSLGRTVPLSAEVGPPRQGRFTGMFYFLWLGQHGRADSPFVITDIVERIPNALQLPNSPPWGPLNGFHYWAEPVYGYYMSNDPWVLRRHAWMLADAGVDTLILDVSNAYTYRTAYIPLCETFAQIRREGEPTPQIAFLLNTSTAATAQDLYQNFYRPGQFEDLWFRWEGKPLILADAAQVSPELRSFFTLRRAHWPNTRLNTQNAWHWQAAFPQVYGFTADPNRPEEVSVSVAQNLRIGDGAVTDMSNGDARGRSFQGGARMTEPGAIRFGYNFQEQWARAHELSPPFVMITGWNEWVAQRFSKPGKPVVFVDQFDDEHSRDIEMVKDRHLDNYYYQLVANVRRYKGAPELDTPSTPFPIDGFEAWRWAGARYTDHQGETIPRNFNGTIRGLRYTNNTGLNDFLELRVSHDADTIYFYARTADDVARPGDGRMMLLIDVADSGLANWEGYSFAINRVPAPAAGMAVLERNLGDGWHWEQAAQVAMRVRANELYFAVPRSALNALGDEFTLDFKWVDGLPDSPSAEHFYTHGDVAPEGRFRYRFRAVQATPAE